MQQTGTIIETRALPNSRVEVEYRFNSELTTSVAVIQQKPMANRQPPHVALAGSRAWLALGQFSLATNDTQGAIMCAKAGLEELGNDYASPKVYDDTKMKLWVAQERIKEGYLEDGAEVMLRVLGTRLYLYDEQLKESLNLS